MRFTWFRRRWDFAVLVGLFILTLPLLNPWVRGDGVGYYAYLRSFWIDGDLDFRNEFQHGNETFLVGTYAIIPTKTGHVRNMWTIGCAVLWTPFFLAAHAFVKVANGLGANIPADGWSLPYVGAVAFASAFYGFAALLIGYVWACSYSSRKAALLATLAIWFGSSLHAYMYFNPSWSHAPSAFIVALFLWIWHRTRGGRAWHDWLLLGFVGGVMSTVRKELAVYLLVPFLEVLPAASEWLRQREWKQLSFSTLASALFMAGVAIGSLPHWGSQWIIYGDLLGSVREHAGGKQWNFFNPALFSTLFSARHGLFSWTPMLLLAVIGWWWLGRRDLQLAICVGIPCLLMWFIIASYPAWWGASSFGNRFFISWTTLFILGLAAFTDAFYRPITPRTSLGLGVDASSAASSNTQSETRRPKTQIQNLQRVFSLPAVYLLLVIWNLGLFFQWGTGMIPRKEAVSWRQVAYNQFVVVPRQLGRHLLLYFSNRTKYRQQLEQTEWRELPGQRRK